MHNLNLPDADAAKELGYTVHYSYKAIPPVSEEQVEREFDLEKVTYVHPVNADQPVTKVVVTQMRGSRSGFDSVELSLVIDGEVWMAPVGYMPPSYTIKFLELSVEAQKHMIGDLLNSPSCDLFTYHD